MAGLLAPVTASAQSGRPITYNVNRTIQSPGMVGCDHPAPIVGEFTFNVPGGSAPPVANVTTSLTSQPEGLHFCLQYFPTSSGCPAENAKCQGHCYPTSGEEVPAAGTSPHDFSSCMPDSGPAWKANLRVYGPEGTYRVTGTVRLAFALAQPVVGAINVTSPRTGDTIPSGGRISVSWMKRGQMADRVRIELVPNIEPRIPLILLPSAPNSGSAQCQLPPNQQGIYRIRVVTVDDQVQGESGEFRVIRAAPPR